ncbi:MAG: Trk family potassium uptake protein [Thermoanaerobacteraceae bacterium]|nr:Trk family potassium uptake protein [Thermoanaerobacteraceae bacterium]
MNNGKKRNLTPPQVLVVGFAIMIGIGTVLLSLPVATENGIPLAPLDAFFTATSATAVTGLIVVDTQKTFSFFGELVILLMIQVGGLGLMTMSTLAALALGKKITLRQRLELKEELGNTGVAGVVRLTKYILIFTFIMEGSATLILTVYWFKYYNLSTAFYLALFHSISAFCNAGFDLFSTSLVWWREDILVNLVITALFIIGGLGFTVISDMLAKRHWRQFSLHTKLVLILTAILLVTGVAGIFIFELTNPQTLGQLSPKGKVLAAFFQGVTPRTAGFNTVDISAMRPSSLFLIILLMFIGASPGSTGGGVKTTTVGSLLAVLYSYVRNKEDVNLLERRLPAETIFKALALVTAAFGIIVATVMILLVTEKQPFLAILFEAASAFGTVGLSMGITSELSVIGKIVISIVMFIGRVGPLTMFFALAQRSKQRRSAVHYPEENILIG